MLLLGQSKKGFAKSTLCLSSGIDMLHRLLHSFSRVRLAFSSQLHPSIRTPSASHFGLLSRNRFQAPIYNTRKSLSTRTMESGVIAVIGTTGVGKSNLSIQLAKELDGEVINGDALQVRRPLIRLILKARTVFILEKSTLGSSDMTRAEQID